ncbi:MAG: adenylyltransferase/cytidyltransferase family protein [Bdellovibrionales bacterium]|nr:adenylyltransferase/cytidyltransferase family protein [Bdellovibrionales bacterium]
MKHRLRVGVFGGSFDPPHFGHLFAAVYALKAYDLDRIWFVPAFHHRFGKNLTPYKHRKKMLSLLVRGFNPLFAIKDIDQAIENPGKSILTLNTLQTMFPKHVFKCVVGSDLKLQTKKWFQASKIEKRFGFLWVPRGPSKNNQMYIPNIQSSDIRHRFLKKPKRPIKPNAPLPPSVLEYIKAHHLYT